MDKTELRVLLVEDDSSFAGLIKYYMKSYRNYFFNIDWVDSAEKGIEKLSNAGDYDIVILDYYLPGLNGVEALKILKARGISITVVFLTGAKENEIA
jgi:DNA-binding response OmpR family regulator